jgi:hypothetical protein
MRMHPCVRTTVRVYVVYAHIRIVLKPVTVVKGRERKKGVGAERGEFFFFSCALHACSCDL